MFRYGYYGPFLLELSEIDPGCGVEDFNKVVYELRIIIIIIINIINIQKTKSKCIFLENKFKLA